MKKVTIYTDGSCMKNPGGRSSYAAIILMDGKEIEVSGGYHSSTSNRQELIAVIKALEQLKEPCNITIYSDSQYVVKIINSWMNRWIKNNFRDRANVDLLVRLLDISEQHQISGIWVRGHNGNIYNERCDSIAYNISSGITKLNQDYFFNWFMSNENN